MDARVNATVPASQQAMKDAGKLFEPVTYDGAGHGFVRAGELQDASDANRRGRAQAWERWKALIQDTIEVVSLGTINAVRPPAAVMSPLKKRCKVSPRRPWMRVAISRGSDDGS
jgi:hypothetical protein